MADDLSYKIAVDYADIDAATAAVQRNRSALTDLGAATRQAGGQFAAAAGQARAPAAVRATTASTAGDKAQEAALDALQAKRLAALNAEAAKREAAQASERATQDALNAARVNAWAQEAANRAAAAATSAQMLRDAAAEARIRATQAGRTARRDDTEGARQAADIARARRDEAALAALEGNRTARNAKALADQAAREARAANDVLAKSTKAEAAAMAEHKAAEQVLNTRAQIADNLLWQIKAQERLNAATAQQAVVIKGMAARQVGPQPTGSLSTTAGGAGWVDPYAGAKQMLTSQSALRGAIADTNQLRLAVMALRQEAQKPITVDLQLDAIEAAQRNLQRESLRLVNTLSPTEIITRTRALNEAMTNELVKLGERGPGMSQAAYQVRSAAIVGNYVDQFKAMEKAAAATNVRVRELFIGVRSVGSVMVGTSWQGALYFLSQIGRGMTGAALAGGLAAFAIGAVAAATLNLVQAGARVEGINRVFMNLTANAGIAGRELRDAIQAASNGTLSMAQTMTVANRALLAGGAQMANELPRLMEIARASAVASGQDVSYTFNSLVTGIVRGSPKLIDNADIYLKLGDATGAYAKELGKSVTDLTAAERTQATLNAVLRQGQGYIEGMGLSAETAAERIAKLPRAIRDLLDTLGLIAVEQTGASESAETMANDIDRLRQAMDALNRMQSNRQKLIDLGQLDKVKALVDREKEMGRGVQGRSAGLSLFDIPGRIDVARSAVALLLELASAYEKEASAARLASDPEAAFWAGKQRALGAWQQGGAVIDESARALEEYNAVLVENAGKTAGITAQAKALADVVSQIKALANLQGTWQVGSPEMGTTALTTNVTEILKWAEAVQQLGPAQTAVGDDAVAAARDLRLTQLALLQTAAGYDTARGRIEAFQRAAQITGGADALLGMFATLDPMVQRALLDMGLLEVAIADLRRQRGEPVGIDVQVKGLQDALSQIDQLGLRLAATGDTGTGLRFSREASNRMLADLQAHFDAQRTMDAQQMQVLIQQHLQEWETLAEGEIAIRQGLATMGQQLAEQARGLPVAPSLGQQPLLTDTTAIDAYLSRMAQLDPTLRPVIEQTRQHNQALAAQQAAALNAAAALGSPLAALTSLARELYGAGASVLTLVQNIDQMPASLRQAVQSLGLMNAAIAQLRIQASQPVTLAVQTQGLIDAQREINDSALQLTGILSPEQIIAFSSKATNAVTADLERLSRSRQNMTAQEYAIRRKQIVDYYTGLVDEEVRYDQQARSRSKAAARDAKKDASEVRSAVEAVFSQSLEVTAADMLASKVGVYEDKSLEAARRLNAIAERGKAELQKHPDWIQALSIPPEVIGANEEVLKAWAARLSSRVQNLLEPGMINWDAFASEYKQRLDDEATKAFTMDKALSVLKEKGLLEPGKDKETRKRLEEMFGKPTVTFETYFGDATADDPASRAALAFLRDGKNPQMTVDVAYRTVEQQPGQPPGVPMGTIGVGTIAPLPPRTGLAAGVMAPQATSPMLTLPPNYAQNLAAQVDMTGPGQDIAGKLYTSFDTAAKAQTPGVSIATAWGASFTESAPLFAAMGTAAGTATGDAFVAAVEKNVGRVRRRMAELIAPEVADIMRSKRVGGEVP